MKKNTSEASQETKKPEPPPKTEVVIPIKGLPAEPVLYMIRKALFHAADAARNVGNKEHAKAFEEAGRGAKAV